jgi:hypothetical protein
MDYNKEKEMIFCPYCGSKDLIIASDKVQIARIKEETERLRIKSSDNTTYVLVAMLAIYGLVAIIFVMLGK